MMTQDILVMITIIGVFLHMILAYLSKKQINPDIKFDYTFLIAGFAAIFGSVSVMQNLPDEMTIINVLTALGMGFSIDAGMAFINNKTPILNKIELKL